MKKNDGPTIGEIWEKAKELAEKAGRKKALEYVKNPKLFEVFLEIVGIQQAVPGTEITLEWWFEKGLDGNIKAAFFYVTSAFVILQNESCLEKTRKVKGVP